jgi:hypothetical protein
LTPKIARAFFIKNQARPHSFGLTFDLPLQLPA